MILIFYEKNINPLMSGVKGLKNMDKKKLRLSKVIIHQYSGLALLTSFIQVFLALQNRILGGKMYPANIY